MRIHRFVWATILVLTAISLIGTPASSAPTLRRISIATGGTGGVYFVLGGGLARLISQHIPGVQATAEVTSASVDNMRLIGAKRADLALTLNDTAYDAYKGQADFKGNPIPIRVLVPVYDNYNHLVTIEGTGINSIADLKGKRVSVGSPGSGTEVTALRILRAAGIDPDRDIRKERLGVAPSADALKDRKIDAFFWSGGIPTPAVLDLASTPGIRMRLIPLDTVVEALRKEYGPLYFKITIRKIAYPGLTEDVPVVGVANLIVVHKDFPEDLAYAIVKLIFERKQDLVAVHKEAQNISLLRIAGRTPIPFHPGAVRYYREKGVPGF
ncbi:MAG: TAXI family TRAP transporter solute-binding subunit [Armatimonadota bacterium]|nr:TAXI family TRAP transporter solute-binding subunit [Armatimonadota bacterium]